MILFPIVFKYLPTAIKIMILISTKTSPINYDRKPRKRFSNAPMNNISLINLSNMQGFRNPFADDKLLYHKKFEIIRKMI